MWLPNGRMACCYGKGPFALLLQRVFSEDSSHCFACFIPGLLGVLLRCQGFVMVVTKACRLYLKDQAVTMTPDNAVFLPYILPSI
jgi:hypothetical protein